MESVPGKLGGAYVFRGARMPVGAVFENLEDGMTREQAQAVLEFAAHTLHVHA